MIEFETTLKRWGGSDVVLVPIYFKSKEKLEKGSKVRVIIQKIE